MAYSQTAPVQTPNPARELAEEYGVKGRLLLDLDTTIVPVHVVNVRNRRFFAGQYSLTAGGAGNRTIVHLSNDQLVPERTVLVHQFDGILPAGAVVLVRRVTAAVTGLSAMTTFSALDFGAAPVSDDLDLFTWSTRNNTAEPTGVNIIRRSGVAGDPYVIDLWESPIVLRGGPAGTSVGLRGVVLQGADNEAIQGGMIWSVPALDS